MTTELPKEFRIPIAVREVFKEGGKRQVFCVPGVKVAIEEAYVDGDIYKLEKALVVEAGHGVQIPVRSKHSQTSIAGVFAQELDDKSNIISRFPIAAAIQGELEACDSTIGAQQATVGQFTPAPVGGEMMCRFKRFDVIVKGDVRKLVLTSLMIGKNRIGTAAMPFDMVMRDGALSIATVLAPGVLFSFVLGNTSDTPITVSGSLVFETVPGITLTQTPPSRAASQGN
jgi:hypothetical protein